MIFVFLLSLSSSLFTFTRAADPTFLSNNCSLKSFTRNSAYQSNINLLLSSLHSNTNCSDRFSNVTEGQNPDRVYGLFQCRGDITATTCQDCIALASTNATQLCPDKKRAIIWYEECVLRYSDSYIFSTAVRNPGIVSRNDAYVTVDLSRFDELVLGLMNEAASSGREGSQKVSDLKGKFHNLSTTSGRLGGSALLPSCNCRYESYLFYKENLTTTMQPPPLAPTPVTRPKGKSHFSLSVVIGTVAPITVSVVLFIAGYCFMIRRARKKYNTIPEEIEALQFGFGTIQETTNGFSNNNKLGQGGFGEVYKGVLFNQQEIAVKRLSRSSGQGAEEFKNEAWKHWRDGTPTELLDSNLIDSYSSNEVTRCIQVGLLCVQEDPAERPTMATAVLMLNSYSLTLQLPQQPAFFFGTRTDLSMQITHETESDQSKSKSVPWSVDDASITELHPRAADPTYLYHVCSDRNFTRNSTYQTNLNLLLSSLPSNANRSDGFSNTTTGQDPNRVYGLFQCRGDVTTTTCKDSVDFASTDITQRCPVQKGAVIWYDECLLRYSDSNIFTTATRNPGAILSNSINVTIEPTRFQELMLGLMNEAATQAANDPKKFATRKGNSTTSQTLYGLVQCTQDLSNTACSGCLQEAISGLPSGRIGGRILLPSCNCRYELYLFYNENLTLSPPPPASTPSPPSPVTRQNGKSGISSSIIIAIVAAIFISAVLLIAGYYFLTRRARKKYKSVPEEFAGNDITTVESLQFDFGTIQAATNGFSTNKKLGEGGFGELIYIYYQGILPSGQEIAVKRLSKSSGQGAEEFKNEAWKHWRDGTPMQLLDSNLTDSNSRNEVMRCIQVGLLCVQEDQAVRPTMATVVLMLNSYSVTLPLPQQPAFFFGSRTEFSMQITKATDSDQSTSRSMLWSIDDASITEVHPR
ncbi:hypothetical protein Ddye_019572 [Dipteronia dyeriana]|uniref:Gnk2-homologous domain-containing protein n=1 Tax=Dipteronia dyeriana TaxID=168575 RepID=A0AAD9TYB5_9ROSI|nr:hypothetical protein Ddye_019572 [Dipteronia dyeriana]